jgi:hypothetical protein
MKTKTNLKAGKPAFEITAYSFGVAMPVTTSR